MRGCTFLNERTIAAVTPNIGQLNTNVVITGTNLLGGGSSIISVSLAGVAATVALSTNTSVSVVASSGTAGAPGAVSMVANTGAFIQLGSQMWTYAAASNITSVTPSIGQIGTLVTISGSNLLFQGTTVASVSLVRVLAIVASADNFKITVVIDQISIHCNINLLE